jgi:hypothetical protein
MAVGRVRCVFVVVLTLAVATTTPFEAVPFALAAAPLPSH